MNATTKIDLVDQFKQLRSHGSTPKEARAALGIKPLTPAPKYVPVHTVPHNEMVGGKVAHPEFTPEMLAHVVIEMRKSNVAGQYGFRVRLLSDETGDPRLIMAATQYADDHALGVEGVRGERMGNGAQADCASSAGGYTQTRLDALERFRETIKALGIQHSSILFDALVNCMNATDLAEKLRVSDKTAIIRTREALEHLADIYEGNRG